MRVEIPRRPFFGACESDFCAYMPASVRRRIMKKKPRVRIFSDDEPPNIPQPTLHNAILRFEALLLDQEASKILGEGAHGRVYRIKTQELAKHLNAENKKLLPADEFVAVKIMYKNWSKAIWSSVIKTAKSEVTVLKILSAQCKNNNIVCYYADETLKDDADADVAYIVVMGYVKGETLDKFVKRIDHRPADLAYIIYTLARTVAFLHTRNTPIIHGDIKLQNIIIGDDMEPTLVDFGFACAGAIHCVQKFDNAGTPLYMSHKKLLNFLYNRLERTKKKEDPEYAKWKTRVDRLVNNAYAARRPLMASDVVFTLDDAKLADRWALAVIVEIMLLSKSNIQPLKFEQLIDFVSKGYSGMFSTTEIARSRAPYLSLYQDLLYQCSLDILNHPRDPENWPSLESISLSALDLSLKFDEMNVNVRFHARINTAKNPRFVLASVGSAAPMQIWDRIEGRPHCKCTFASVESAARVFAAPAYLKGNAVCPICGDDGL